MFQQNCNNMNLQNMNMNMLYMMFQQMMRNNINNNGMFPQNKYFNNNNFNNNSNNNYLNNNNFNNINHNIFSNNNLNNNNNFNNNFNNNNFNNFSHNNIYNNNFNNNMNLNRNNNISKDKEPEPSIKRTNESMEFSDESSKGDKLRIINFHVSSGLKVMITISINKTIEELFKFFAKKIGVSESLLGKEIYFIFNAITLESNDTRLISQVFFKDLCVVTVVDRKNVIGAK